MPRGTPAASGDAAAGTPPAGGPASASSFNRRSLPGDLRYQQPYAPDQAPLDPVQKALQDSQSMAAASMYRRTEADMAADMMEAEVRKLELELKREELRRARNGGQNDEEANQFTEFIVEELKATREALAQANAAIGAAQRQQYEARLQALQEQLQAMQSAGPDLALEPADPLDALERSFTLVERAQDVVQKAHGRMAPAPQSRGIDPSEIELYKVRMELDRERFLAEQRDRHLERLAELEARQRIEQARLDLDRQRFDQEQRFMNQTLPNMIATAKEVINTYLEHRTTAEPAAAATGFPTAPVYNPLEARAEAAPPPGAQVMQCQAEGCGQTLYYRESWPGLICPRCGTEYKWSDPDQGEEAATGLGVTAEPAAPPMWSEDGLTAMQSSASVAEEVAALYGGGGGNGQQNGSTGRSRASGGKGRSGSL